MDISFRTEHISSHSGQHNYRLVANIDKKDVGYIDYSIFKEKPDIEYIKVQNEFKRKGIGTELIRHLQSLYPEQEIGLGYQTDDGGKFLSSLKREFIPDKKHALLKTLLANVKEKLEKIWALPNVSEKEYKIEQVLSNHRYALEKELEDTPLGKYIII